MRKALDLSTNGHYPPIRLIVKHLQLVEDVLGTGELVQLARFI